MHTIQITDDLWNVYDGSPSAMRDALWAYAFHRQEQLTFGAEPRLPDADSFDTDNLGTIITLRYEASCTDPDHGDEPRRLLAGSQAAFSRADSGFPRFLCERCYARRTAEGSPPPDGLDRPMRFK
jgi:hypothetical protein